MRPRYLFACSATFSVVKGGASVGGATKAVKTDEFDIDIEQEARGQRVKHTLCMLLFKVNLCRLSHGLLYGYDPYYVCTISY